MVLSTEIFHVHTSRCRHAEDISDEAFILKAIELGATGIWFTDHAPFPGNPFRNRMEYDELNEYISTLSQYKEAYSDRITVHIGLEIEYFPSFSSYYEELNSNENIEMLLLGQHMAEDIPGHYTFSWEKERLKEEEYIIKKHLIDILSQHILPSYHHYYYKIEMMKKMSKKKLFLAFLLSH